MVYEMGSSNKEEETMEFHFHVHFCVRFDIKIGTLIQLACTLAELILQ